MSKEETTIIKGLAILMMLWLHLFNDAHVGAAAPCGLLEECLSFL